MGGGTACISFQGVGNKGLGFVCMGEGMGYELVDGSLSLDLLYQVVNEVLHVLIQIDFTSTVILVQHANNVYGALN